MLRRLLICLALPLMLAACGADPVWAPDSEIQKYRYVSGEAPSLTLFTVVGTTTGAGGHSALMIDGRERVIFDPAGTWNHPWAPERNDVHYCINEQMRKFYIDYHARETWYVRAQKIPITLEQADALIARAQNNGAVSKMMCADNVAQVLRDVGYDVPGTLSPLKLMRAFGELPGVSARDHFDDDPDDNSGVLLVQQEPVRHGTELPF